MFLKRLFYASISLLVLAAILHLGYQNAQGQIGSSFFLGTSGGTPFVVLTDGSAYMPSSTSTPAPWVPIADVPVKSNPHAEYGTAIVGAGDRVVVTNTGRVFVLLGGNNAWIDIGNVPTGSTPAQLRTWGSVKVQQR